MPTIKNVYETAAEIIVAVIASSEVNPTMFIAKQLKKFYDAGYKKGYKKGYAEGMYDDGEA